MEYNKGVVGSGQNEFHIHIFKESLGAQLLEDARAEQSARADKNMCS